MPRKVQAGVSIDSELWESAKVLFRDNPQLGSISAFFELQLRNFMSVMPSFLEQARAGDAQSALKILNRFATSETANSLQNLNILQDHLDLGNLTNSFVTGGDSKSKKRKKSV
jgi:hypothetical protein